jgi:LysM repeat protein
MVTTQRRAEVARLAAPAAFLLAVTIAVVLVRAGLREGVDPATGPRPAADASAPRTVVVHAGETLEGIARRNGTTVTALRELNPGLDPVGLRIGTRLRVE